MFIGIASLFQTIEVDRKRGDSSRAQASRQAAIHHLLFTGGKRNSCVPVDQNPDSFKIARGELEFLGSIRVVALRQFQRAVIFSQFFNTRFCPIMLFCLLARSKESVIFRWFYLNEAFFPFASAAVDSGRRGPIATGAETGTGAVATTSAVLDR